MAGRGVIRIEVVFCHASRKPDKAAGESHKHRCRKKQRHPGPHQCGQCRKEWK